MDCEREREREREREIIMNSLWKVRRERSSCVSFDAPSVSDL